MSDRYNDPTTGIAEFNGKLAEVFDVLEVDVEYRDLNANRDNYTPRDNAKFLATDTADIYIGDGTNWISLEIAVQSDLVDVSDGGVTVVSDAKEINFTDSGDATVTVTQDGETAVVNVDATAEEGATADATYVTVNDETVDLANSQQHANLSGADLHSPAEHAIGGTAHSASTLADLNTKVSDATLDQTGDSRPPDAHDNAAHTENYATETALTSHTGDTSNPHSVTNTQVGVTSGTNIDGNYEITIDGDVYEFIPEA